MNWERGVLLRKQMANGFVKNYMVLNVYFKTGSKWIFHNGLPMTYNKAFRIHIMEVMIRNNTNVSETGDNVVENVLHKDLSSYEVIGILKIK